MYIGLAEIGYVLAVLLLFAAVSGVALGLMLVFRSHPLERVNRAANRTISIERWFYRNHRPLGLFILIGASYVLLYFSWLFDEGYILHHLPPYLPEKRMEGLLDAIRLISLTGAVLAWLAGLVVLVRPSLLKGLEKAANRWMSLHPTPMLDWSFSFIARHEQVVGWLLLSGSGFLIYKLLGWLA